MGRDLSQPERPRMHPNLFIVGAPKCGTTSLHGYLSQHPAIFMSQVKEPRYWSDDLRESGKAFHSAALSGRLRSVRRWPQLPAYLLQRWKARPTQALGIEREGEYLAVFEGADPARHRFVGEASADSMWSSTAAARIARFCPGARIVVMLREPISYIVSIHHESLSGVLGESVKSLETALELESLRRHGEAVPNTARYPFSVCYRAQAQLDQQVQRFLDVFDREQIHFMLLDDLGDRPVAELDRLFGWLGVDRIAADLDLRRLNVSGERLSQLGRRTIDELRSEFDPVVTRLEVQTGLPLRGRWGYDP